MFLDGFDLLDRIWFVYIVMTLIVDCLFGCVCTMFVVVTLYIPSCVDQLPKGHMMCAHAEKFAGLLCIIVGVYLTIITILLAQSPLCLLLLVRLGGYIVNSLDCYSYRLIGKLTVFFQFQESTFIPLSQPLPHFLKSRRVSPLLNQSLVLITTVCLSVT
jgi:hypothetical protein